MHSLRFLVVSTIFSLPFLVPLFAFAQTDSNQSYQDIISKLMQEQKDRLVQAGEIQKTAVDRYLDVKISPQTPAPSVPVRISVESYLTDLYKANISWSLNGKVLERGLGKTSFSFQNGPSGEATVVSLKIISNTGEVVNKDFSFSPVGITTMWEADTYTPPFYKGKPLLTPQAGVRIVAIPDNVGAESALGAGKLVYTWRKDDYVDATASGYGKNVFSFVGPKPLTNTKITLSASTLDDTAQSEMRIYLPQIRPLILFYEKDPLLGVLYNKPLGAEYTLDKKEVSLVAEPFYFSNERGEAQTLKYNWSVNNGDVQNYGRDITLRNEKGAKGTSVVSLAMRGVVQTFQTANKEIRLNFTEGPATSRPTF